MKYIWYTKIICKLKNKLYGSDDLGNLYYEENNNTKKNPKRVVIYKNFHEPSSVTPEWYNWIRGFPNKTTKNLNIHKLQKEYKPNMTGTQSKYKPNGSLLNTTDSKTSKFKIWNHSKIKNK